MSPLTLRLHNVRSFAEASVDLGPLTVLVGPNAAGKSTVLNALHLLGQLAHKDWNELLSGERALDGWQRAGTEGSQLRIEVTEPREGGGRSVALARREDGDTVSDQPTAWWSTAQDEGWSQAFSHAELAAAPDHVRHWLRHMVLLRLDARRIAAPSVPDRSNVRMEFDGFRLPSVLAHLKLEHQERFDAVIAAARQVIPQLERVRPVSTDVRRTIERAFLVGDEVKRGHEVEIVVGHKLMFDFQGAAGVPAWAASEGTLLTLALMTLLHLPSRPPIVLLDDLERALHPTAARELVGHIRRIVQQDRHVRVMATTHSPYLVDALEPDEVRVVVPTAHGSEIHPLDHHPVADRALQALTPGEFWMAEGERWPAVEGVK